MLLGSGLVQNQISKIHSNVNKNLNSRNILTQRHRHIRNTLLHINDMLAKFQIDPATFHDSEYVYNLVSQTINHTDRLSQHPWVRENYSATITELKTTIMSLNDVINSMIKVRLEPQKLFPSLKIADMIMRPANDAFLERINLVLSESEEELTSANKETFLLFIKLRQTWVKMIANFRMYMLNRLNSFQETMLQTQLNVVETYLNNIDKDIAYLEKIEQKGALDFQHSIGLEKITFAVSTWKKAFEKVKKINASGQWRMDLVIYQNDIEPKLSKITELLRILDIAIENFNKQDVVKLSSITQNQVNILWGMTLAGLSLLIFGFIILNKLILEPLQKVTLAMKNEALGEPQLIPLESSLDETKNLIDAFTEMRHQIHHRQDALEYHALHDNLTGLANRALLTERLQQAIHNAQQERTEFALLIMDLDRFKEINDTLGHPIGDKLLAQVGKRLTHTLRQVDVVARLGGDEFAILLSPADEEHVIRIAHKVLSTFEKVFQVNELQLFVGISIGISMFPRHGITYQSLFQRADVAMYVAKKNRYGYAIYDSSLDPHSVGKLSLASELKTALENNLFEIYYQPVINIKNKKIVSIEALLRWTHPTHGNVSPIDIIPLAEQTGLIKPLTRWVLETAITKNRELHSSGIDIKTAVNLSVFNFQEPDLVEYISNLLTQYKLPEESLVLEITESAMMMNPQRAIEILTAFDQMGIELAVDDFGTGFSSLSYLKQLPVDTLKIDKSFVMDMIENDNDAVLVKSTIDLAHNMGINVIAEGIESEEILDILDILSCEYGQGYFISHPLDSNSLDLWLKDHNFSA